MHKKTRVVFVFVLFSTIMSWGDKALNFVNNRPRTVRRTLNIGEGLWNNRKFFINLAKGDLFGRKQRGGGGGGGMYGLQGVRRSLHDFTHSGVQEGRGLDRYEGGEDLFGQDGGGLDLYESGEDLFGQDGGGLDLYESGGDLFGQDGGGWGPGRTAHQRHCDMPLHGSQAFEGFTQADVRRAGKKIDPLSPRARKQRRCLRRLARTQSRRRRRKEGQEGGTSLLMATPNLVKTFAQQPQASKLALQGVDLLFQQPHLAAAAGLSSLAGIGGLGFLLGRKNKSKR